MLHVMSNATVITEAQLEAMRAKVRQRLASFSLAYTCHQQLCLRLQVYQHEATPQQTERLRLKALSTQRTARWPNTLQVNTSSEAVQMQADTVAAHCPFLDTLLHFRLDVMPKNKPGETGWQRRRQSVFW